MKKLSQTLAIAALLGVTQSAVLPVAFAQVPARVVPGVAGIGNTVTVVPGTFEHIQVDAPAFTSVFREVNAADSQWVKEAVTETDKIIVKLKDLHVSLMSEANKSVSLPMGMELSDYLALTAPATIELEALKTRFDVMASVPAARNSANVVKLESGKMTINAHGAMKSVDFNGIKAIMDEKVKNVQNAFANITFYIHAKNPDAGKPPRTAQRLGDALNPVFQRNFSGDEINKWTIDAERIERNAKQILVIENDKTRAEDVRTLQSLIDQYGVKDRYMFSKLDTVGHKAAEQSIADLYLAYSVLRFKMAVPIGAFGTPDTRKNFDFQRIPMTNSNKIEITPSVALNAADLTAARRWIVTALNTQRDWAGLNSETFMDKLKNPLSMLSNWVNLAMFREGWSKINAFILQCMLGEIEEEFMLTQAGGMELLKERLLEKVRTSPDPAKALAQYKKINAALGNARGNIDKNNAIGAGGTVMSIQKTATTIDRYLVKMTEASALRRQHADMTSTSSVFRAAQDERMDDLMNELNKVVHPGKK